MICILKDVIWTVFLIFLSETKEPYNRYRQYRKYNNLYRQNQKIEINLYISS